MMMKLTQNFSLTELTASDLASRKGYNLVADRWTAEQLERLTVQLLQPIRDKIGVPMVITSGYRPPWLNLLVNGSVTSMHQFGCAADFVTPGMALPMVFKQIKEMKLEGIDQLILEEPNTGGGWIHIGQALPGKKPRQQYMLATLVNGTKRYEDA